MACADRAVQPFSLPTLHLTTPKTTLSPAPIPCRRCSEQLRACIKRKAVAFRLFKAWYWESFDADVQVRGLAAAGPLRGLRVGLGAWGNHSVLLPMCRCAGVGLGGVMC